MRKPKAPYVQLDMAPPDDVPDNFDPKTWIMRNADLIAPFGEIEACCDATITRTSFREQLALMGEFLYADGTKLPEPVRSKFDSAVLAMAMSALPDQTAANPTARIRTVTPEEFAWTARQPVVGRPNLTRLCAALETTGMPPIAIERSEDGDALDFRLERSEEVRGLDEEQTLR